MRFKYLTYTEKGIEKLAITTSLNGINILTDPFLNKDLAFNSQERDEFNLQGLLPAQHENLAIQIKRCYEHLQKISANLSKFIFLMQIYQSNVTLFFALLSQYKQELLPIVYTPTLSIACQQFSELQFCFKNIIYVNYANCKHLENTLASDIYDDIKIIIVTDGERVLSLGDQGIGGAAIPVGKSILYSLCAGIHPESILPIFLDVGTNNQERLQDPFYMGLKHPRLSGEAYASFIDNFVTIIKKRFPTALLHWEDFADHNAHAILNKYQHLGSINGDLQGTPVTALAAILSAVEFKHESLANQVFLIVGTDRLAQELQNWLIHMLQTTGITASEAQAKIQLIDAETKNLSDVIRQSKTSVLIGINGIAGIFNQDVAIAMQENTTKPIIFALSNPNTKSEAVPKDILAWTNYQAIVCTGSPFDPVIHEQKKYPITQVNNMFIFPGFGLGILAAEVSHVPDELYFAAALNLSLQAKKYHQDSLLLPPLDNIREISYQIACAVAKKALDLGIAHNLDYQNIENKIQKLIWLPTYLPIKKMA